MESPITSLGKDKEGRRVCHIEGHGYFYLPKYVSITHQRDNDRFVVIPKCQTTTRGFSVKDDAFSAFRSAVECCLEEHGWLTLKTIRKSWVENPTISEAKVNGGGTLIYLNVPKRLRQLMPEKWPKPQVRIGIYHSESGKPSLMRKAEALVEEMKEDTRLLDVNFEITIEDVLTPMDICPANVKG